MGWKASLVSAVVWGDGICNNPLAAQGPQRETVLLPLRDLLCVSRSYLLCFASSKPSCHFLFGCNEPFFFFLQKLLTTVPLTELLTNLTSFKANKWQTMCKQSRKKKIWSQVSTSSQYFCLRESTNHHNVPAGYWDTKGIRSQFLKVGRGDLVLKGSVVISGLEKCREFRETSPR